jgi:hypothetical protein
MSAEEKQAQAGQTLPKIIVLILVFLLDGSLADTIKKEFDSMRGLKSYLSVYLPYKYPHLREGRVIYLSVPADIHQEALALARCKAVNLGYEAALELIQLCPLTEKDDVLHFVNLLPYAMRQASISGEMLEYFTHGYVAALEKTFGPDRRPAPASAPVVGKA